MKIKLPKQWKHWVKSAGLKLESHNHKWKRSNWALFTLVGRNRVWRVNCDAKFECSCPSEHFDRWANSRGSAEYDIPKTKQEFLDLVKKLYIESKEAV